MEMRDPLAGQEWPMSMPKERAERARTILGRNSANAMQADSGIGDGFSPTTKRWNEESAKCKERESGKSISQE